MIFRSGTGLLALIGMRAAFGVLEAQSVRPFNKARTKPWSVAAGGSGTIAGQAFDATNFVAELSKFAP